MLKITYLSDTYACIILYSKCLVKYAHYTSRIKVLTIYLLSMYVDVPTNRYLQLHTITSDYYIFYAFDNYLSGVQF